jgi:bacterioferritin
VRLLNEQLTHELTAVNQYFLHARMQHNYGWSKLAARTYQESVTEMKHAQAITDRILFLEGVPDLGRLGTLRIGATAREMLEADAEIEREAIEKLRSAIDHVRTVGDATTATLFEVLLASEEEHLDHLETQLSLHDRLGEALYLSHLVDPPE